MVVVLSGTVGQGRQTQYTPRPTDAEAATLQLPDNVLGFRCKWRLWGSAGVQSESDTSRGDAHSRAEVSC